MSSLILNLAKLDENATNRWKNPMSMGISEQMSLISQHI